MITIRFANQKDLPGLLPLMTQLGYRNEGPMAKLYLRKEINLKT